MKKMLQFLEAIVLIIILIPIIAILYPLHWVNQTVVKK